MDLWRLNPNGRQENGSEPQDDFVQPGSQTPRPYPPTRTPLCRLAHGPDVQTQLV